VSVLEVMAMVSDVVGFDVNAQIGPRRPGDPAQLVALADKINTQLGWSAESELREMVTSAWEAWNRPEDGEPS
jgi:UDP-glucose 4-epimerase